MAIENLPGLKRKSIPVIFLIDNSASMQGPGIQQVNINLKEYVDAMKIDPETKDAVELTIITFSNTAKTIMMFEPIKTATIPSLNVESNTNLAAGISELMRVIYQKTDYIKAECKRPLLVFMSDGNATCKEEDWRAEIERMNQDFIMKRSVRVALGAGTEIKDSTLEAFKLNIETDVAVRISSIQDLKDFFNYIRTITKEISTGRQPSKPIGGTGNSGVIIV